MKFREVLIGTVCLSVGLGGGFFTANTLNRSDVISPTADGSASGPSASTATVAVGEAQQDVSAALQSAESDPQNFAAQMIAGDMYAKIGRFEKAVEFYKRGVLINPSNFQANVVLANALFDSQKFEEAESYYAKALEINPKDINARTDLGATFVERAVPNYDRAIAELSKVREAEPGHLPSLYYLGIATLRKGDKIGAEKILAELKATGPNSELVGKLRQNLEAQGITQ